MTFSHEQRSPSVEETLTASGPTTVAVDARSLPALSSHAKEPTTMAKPAAFAAKPASKSVRARPVKAIKDAVG